MTFQMGIPDILKIMPHRYPFLLVDRVLALDIGASITAIKNVSMNEQFFTGHFPGCPVMPGVLILEAMAQTGGILAYTSWGEEKRNRPLLLVGMDKVRFRKPVVPGDQLFMKLDVRKFRDKVTSMHGVATVDGDLAAEAEFTAVLGDL